MTNKSICQSCGMTINSDQDKGTNKDGTCNQDYCKHCYQQGDFTNMDTMEDMIESCIQFEIEAGVYTDTNEARESMTKQFVELKRWRSNNMQNKSTLVLGCTYLYVHDMDKAQDFYNKLLAMKPTKTNKERWAQYNFNGNCIALMNKSFDDKLFNNNTTSNKIFSKEYIDKYTKMKIQYGNNFVLNFWMKDLLLEYKRIKSLNIGEVSPIMSVDFGAPYYFFTITDPDGNTLEMNGEQYNMLND